MLALLREDDAMVKGHDRWSPLAPGIPWMMETGEEIQAERITGIHSL